jgi:hypothetical protein
MGILKRFSHADDCRHPRDRYSGSGLFCWGSNQSADLTTLQ